MATRRMEEKGTGMAGATKVRERRLVPTTPNSANDNVLQKTKADEPNTDAITKAIRRVKKQAEVNGRKQSTKLKRKRYL